jgi:hypothetical protein
MPTILRDVRDLLVSLKLTVVLLVFSIILILAATLDQVNLGIWAVQEKYFYTFVVYMKVGSISLAIFPGGFTIGGLLLVNLLAAHFYRFKFTWRKVGIWLAHAGLILLIVGQLLTGLWQDEYQLRLDQGQTKNFSESYRNVELVLTDTTDPKFDEVVAIPERALARLETVQHPKLPFRVVVKTYFPNSILQMRGPMQPADPAAPATQGVGPRVLATLQPLTYKQEERNIPSAYVELVGPEDLLDLEGRSGAESLLLGLVEEAVLGVVGLGHGVGPDAHSLPHPWAERPLTARRPRRITASPGNGSEP